MLTTVCSNCRATKALIGHQMATALPAPLLQAFAIHTAEHTSQLHRMLWLKACIVDNQQRHVSPPEGSLVLIISRISQRFQKKDTTSWQSTASAYAH